MTLSDVEVADDDCQKVVEVMRDSTGELADGFHFLRLGELLARLPQLPTGVAENPLCPPAQRNVSRQGGAGHGDADHEHEKERRGFLMRAGRKRSASKYRAPKNEAKEYEGRSGGVAWAAAQRRPQ